MSNFTFDIVTPPSAEVITLAEAKSHLRVTHDYEDDYIEALIPIARGIAEDQCGRYFLTTTVKMTLGCFPDHYSPITLCRSPVRSVVSLEYCDPSSYNGYIAMAEDDPTLGWSLQGGSLNPGISKRSGWWPTINMERSDAVRVVYTCGFADDAGSVPAAYRDLFKTAQLATKWVLHDLYDNRTSLSDVRVYEVNGPISNLLNRLSTGCYPSAD